MSLKHTSTHTTQKNVCFSLSRALCLSNTQAHTRHTRMSVSLSLSRALCLSQTHKHTHVSFPPKFKPPGVGHWPKLWSPPPLHTRSWFLLVFTSRNQHQVNLDYFGAFCLFVIKSQKAEMRIMLSSSVRCFSTAWLFVLFAFVMSCRVFISEKCVRYGLILKCESACIV